MDMRSTGLVRHMCMPEGPGTWAAGIWSAAGEHSGRMGGGIVERKGQLLGFLRKIGNAACGGRMHSGGRDISEPHAGGCWGRMAQASKSDGDLLLFWILGSFVGVPSNQPHVDGQM
jgi:hypothetical protein